MHDATVFEVLYFPLKYDWNTVGPCFFFPAFITNTFFIYFIPVYFNLYIYIFYLFNMVTASRNIWKFNVKKPCWIKIKWYGSTIVHCATREKKIYFTRVVVTHALLGHQTSHSQNKCFSCVARDFFSTVGSESVFVCPARGNKVHFMAR